MTDKQKKLAEDNIKLVPYVIKTKISLGSDEYDDLFQAGCLALCRAASRFDESKGFAFSTYAISYIVSELKNYKRDFGNKNHGIRISRSIKDVNDKVEAYIINNNLNLDNSLDLNLALKELDIERYHKIKTVSIEKELYNGKDGVLSLANILEDKRNCYDELFFNMQLEYVSNKIKGLISDRWYVAYNLAMETYLNDGVSLTITEIAKILGYSRQNVSNIFSKCKQYFKEYF